MEPAEFAAARLDEDEAMALAAGEDDAARTWTGGDNGYEDSGIVSDGRGWTVVYDEGSPDTAQAVHIGRHDPARVLREAAAGRRILERHRDCVPYGGGLCDHAGIVDLYAGPCPDMRDLLARWDDHRDYDPAWRFGVQAPAEVTGQPPGGMYEHTGMGVCNKGRRHHGRCEYGNGV